MKRTRSFLLLFLGLTAVLCSLTAWTVYREHRQERLNRALIAAVKRNDTKAVIALLDQGADANCHDEPYRPVPSWQMLWDRLRGVKPKPSDADTPLLVALQSKIYKNNEIVYTPENLPLLQVLLDHKADVNVRDQDGDTPFECALGEVKQATAHLMLKYGVNLKSNRGIASTVEFNGTFVDSTEFLSDMLKRGVDVNERDSAGYTALWRAVYQQDVEAVHLLLSYHADVTLRSSDGETPLALAKSVLEGTMNKEECAQTRQIIDLLQQAGAKE